MDTIDPMLGYMPPGAGWSRRGFVVTTLAAGFALSVQPIAAQTVIHTDSTGLDAGEVKVPVADRTIPAYRAMPATGGPFPTVLVVEEVFGVHEHIQDICRRFAKLGYYAIAPELFSRIGDPAKAKDQQDLITNIVMKAPTAQLMSDLDAAAAFAKVSGKADTGRLGVIGFCWGGFVTWMYTAHNPGLKAAAAWYGPDRKITELTPQNPLAIAGELKAPLIAFYGGQDKSIPLDTIEKRQAACQAAGGTCEYKIYPDAPHGFNADYRPSYRAADAKDAWARTLAWFKKYGVA